MYPVTVIVPIYNTQTYLHACMESLAVQAVRPLEVLFIDNGSPDGAAGLAQKYIADHSLERDWHVISTGDNRGPGAARNVGLERAQGEYVAFVDGDDWIEPDMLAFLYSAAKHADCAPCDISSSAAVKEYGTQRGELMLNPRVGTGRLTTAKRKHLLMHYVSNFTTMIYRRAWLQDAGIRFPETFSAEDSAFVALCYLAADSIAQCDIPFYHYRIHAASVSHRKGVNRSRDKRVAMRSILDNTWVSGMSLDLRCVLWWVFFKKAVLAPLLGR